MSDLKTIPQSAILSKRELVFNN